LAKEGSLLLLRTKGEATHPDLLGKEEEAEDWGKEFPGSMYEGI
jgi:hypothetical protein